ncbi:VOC family protein [Chryseobacterium sp. FH1]|uniref:VOC family protein n=1 Tax=Chryseobacterium sp. FH1 TaxID=1233951 RepID=UPI0004E4184F|nr:VOC family protein [Chryseobacterium sp. FH1]KFC22477.1 glyoxalase [Chryseobacterium sp. FH1]
MNLQDNIIGFHHYSLKAVNFEETVGFYETLGFKVQHSWSLPDFELEKCVMMHHAKINSFVEICDKNASMPSQGRKRKANEEFIENSILHICFVVKDAEKARIEALKNGATDLSEGVFEIDLINGHKSVNVRNSLVYSPNGEVIEFLESVSFD